MSEESAGAAPPVEVRRSARRRRTVSAYYEGEKVIVLIPARFSKREEAEWVASMLTRLQRRQQKVPRSDAELARRAERLADRYLQGQRAASVRWVNNQRGRWGSCTLDDRTVRLSSRLREFPDWVIDYVLLHELTHLRVAGHGPDFWAQLRSYPKTERAKGFLEGVSYAEGLDFPPGEGGEDDEGD